jgi:hypothetical protein
MRGRGIKKGATLAPTFLTLNLDTMKKHIAKIRTSAKSANNPNKKRCL